MMEVEYSGQPEGVGQLASHANGTPRSANDRDLRILAACREPCSLDQAARASGVPRSTSHRRLNRLFKRGLIGHRDGIYETSEAGVQLLEAGAAAKEAPDALAKCWPFLKLLPTPIHAALASLILFAHIARRDRASDDRNPGFILLGPTQRLKSWLIKATTYLAGGDPESSRVPMMQVRGRGLLARMDAKGRKAYESQSIKESIIWLEEFSLSDNRVKRDVEGLLHGTVDVKVDNEIITVEGVPVIELNPIKKDSDLEGQTGLDVPRLRRCVVADFHAVRLTAKQRAQSPALLEKIKATAPAKLPRVSRSPGGLCQAYVDAAFEQCVRPEAVDYTDPSRILTLIAGATALLPDLEAAQAVVNAYFVTVETVGFMRSGWRETLARIKPSNIQDSLLAQTPAPLPSAVAAPAEKPTPDAPPTAQPAGAHDLDGLLLGLKVDMERLGYELPRDAEKVRTIGRIGRRLEAERIPPKAFADVASSMGTLMDLKDEIAKLGASEQRVRELVALDHYMDERGVTHDGIRALADDLFVAHSNRVDGPASKLVLGLARQGMDVQTEIGRLSAECQRLENRKEELVEEMKALRTQRREEMKKIKLVDQYIAKIPALQAEVEALEAANRHLWEQARKAAGQNIIHRAVKIALFPQKEEAVLAPVIVKELETLCHIKAQAPNYPDAEAASRRSIHTLLSMMEFLDEQQKSKA